MSDDPYRSTAADEPVRVYALRAPWMRVVVQLVAGVALFSCLALLCAVGVLDLFGRAGGAAALAFVGSLGLMISAVLPLFRRRYRAIELHRDRLVVVGGAGGATTFPLDGLRVDVRTTSVDSELLAGQVDRFLSSVPVSLGFSANGKRVEIETERLAQPRLARELADAIASMQKAGLTTSTGEATTSTRVRLEEPVSSVEPDDDDAGGAGASRASS